MATSWTPIGTTSATWAQPAGAALDFEISKLTSAVGIAIAGFDAARGFEISEMTGVSGSGSWTQAPPSSATWTAA